MMKQALIVQGGWVGHEPVEVSTVLAELLRRVGFSVEVSDTLDSFLDEEKLKSLNLIVPIWTMGQITSKRLTSLLSAVKSGVGIAGCHGGLGDSFRNEPEFQYMVGGQWVAHPGNDGVHYDVNILDPEHPITQGMADFHVCSEQYYMHVDPAINVLATTRFFGKVEMPVAWTKTYGDGRVFYCSLGHQADIVSMPEVSLLIQRGMAWAAK